MQGLLSRGSVGHDSRCNPRQAQLMRETWAGRACQQGPAMPCWQSAGLQLPDMGPNSAALCWNELS